MIESIMIIAVAVWLIRLGRELRNIAKGRDDQSVTFRFGRN